MLLQRLQEDNMLAGLQATLQFAMRKAPPFAAALVHSAALDSMLATAHDRMLQAASAPSTSTSQRVSRCIHQAGFGEGRLDC